MDRQTDRQTDENISWKDILISEVSFLTADVYIHMMITQEAIDFLSTYSWPCVREYESLIDILISEDVFIVLEPDDE